MANVAINEGQNGEVLFVFGWVFSGWVNEARGMLRSAVVPADERFPVLVS